MRFQQLQLGSLANFQYLLADDGGQGLVVDPGVGAREILEAARGMDVTVSHVLVTHGHHDHVEELGTLVEATGADVVAHPASPLEHVDVPVEDGDVVQVGGLQVTALHTPGHAPDHVVYRADPYLFTGDLLFVGECGRTDLGGGDPRAMWRSLFEVLGNLPGELVVCPGHDYGASPTSTLEREFATNYTLEERGVDDFVRFMAEP